MQHSTIIHHITTIVKSNASNKVYKRVAEQAIQTHRTH